MKNSNNNNNDQKNSYEIPKSGNSLWNYWIIQFVSSNWNSFYTHCLIVSDAFVETICKSSFHLNISWWIFEMFNVCICLNKQIDRRIFLFQNQLYNNSTMKKKICYVTSVIVIFVFYPKIFEFAIYMKKGEITESKQKREMNEQKKYETIYRKSTQLAKKTLVQCIIDVCFHCAFCCFFLSSDLYPSNWDRSLNILTVCILTQSFIHYQYLYKYF